MPEPLLHPERVRLDTLSARPIAQTDHSSSSSTRLFDVTAPVAASALRFSRPDRYG
jgi:hypothetical protein